MATQKPIPTAKTPIVPPAQLPEATADVGRNRAKPAEHPLHAAARAANAQARQTKDANPAPVASAKKPPASPQVTRAVVRFIDRSTEEDGCCILVLANGALIKEFSGAGAGERAAQLVAFLTGTDQVAIIGSAQELDKVTEPAHQGQAPEDDDDDNNDDEEDESGGFPIKR